MTEQEWLECTDPTPMLEFLRDMVSDRKMRLFACGCCRRMWDLLSRKCRKSLVIAERYADGEVPEEKLSLAGFRAQIAAKIEHRRDETANGTAMWAVAWLCERPPAFDRLLQAVEIAARSESWPITPDRLTDAQHKQVPPLRCVFGNPFRPVTLNPTWLMPNIVSLAQAIYAERAFDRLPILADALEDAGCDYADILNHCRQPGEHVRGC